MSAYEKPLPKPTETSRPFWEAAKQHRLQLQQCGTCKAFIYYPRDRCPRCLSESLAWRPVSGKGKVYSYTIVHNAGGVWPAEYAVGYVDFPEGVRVFGQLRETAPERLSIGARIAVEPAVIYRRKDGTAVTSFRFHVVETA